MRGAGPAQSLQPETWVCPATHGECACGLQPAEASSPLLWAGPRQLGPAVSLASGDSAGRPWQGLTHSRCSASGK